MTIIEIYQNQSAVDITLDTGVDLTGNLGVFIVYRKPNGTTGTWTGVQNGMTAITYSAATTAEFNQVGDWGLQTKVIESDGRIAYGSKKQTKLRVLSRV